MRRLWLCVAILALVPAPALADAHCDDDGSAGLSDHITGKATKTCQQDEQTGEGDQSGGPTGPVFPRSIWEMHDYFYDWTAGCPEGWVNGVRRYYLEQYEGDRSTHLFDAPGCVPLPADAEPASGGAGDPGVTVVTDVVRERLPVPTVALSPGERGLVGLDTHFWYEADGAVEPIDHDDDPSTPPRLGLRVTASVSGYTITATAFIDEYRWTVDDGVTLTATVPGTADDPAATHLYERKGPRTLEAATVWRGTYTWEAGAASGTGDLGSITLSSAPRDYHVHEVRTAPGDG